MRRDDIRDLKEQRRRVHASMVELTQKAEAEERDLTAEEAGEFDKLEKNYEELETRAVRAEQLWRQEQSVKVDLERPLELKFDESEVPQTLKEYRERSRGEVVNDSPEYRSAFFHYLSARDDTELDVEEKRVLSRLTAGAGGNLAPPYFAREIISISRFFGSVGQLAGVMETGDGLDLAIPGVTSHGAAAWTAEAGAFSPSDEVFRTVTLKAYKEAAKVIVSEELLQDAIFDLEGYLVNELAERFGVLENTAFIIGDGTGKPSGITLAGEAVPVFTAATGNATSFNYAALVSALYTIPAQYRQNLAIIAADGAIKNLRLLVDGQGRPLWETNIQVGAPDSLLGIPIYPDPDLAAPAANAVSMLIGNFRRGYRIRRAGGIGVQRQNELHSDNGEIGFRAYQRVDGRVVLPAAMVQVKHSAT